MEVQAAGSGARSRGLRVLYRIDICMLGRALCGSLSLLFCHSPPLSLSLSLSPQFSRLLARLQSLSESLRRELRLVYLLSRDIPAPKNCRNVLPSNCRIVCVVKKSISMYAARSSFQETLAFGRAILRGILFDMYNLRD